MECLKINSSKYLITFAFLLVLGVILWQNHIQFNKLQKNYKVGICKVYETGTGKYGASLLFRFEYNGIVYKGQNSFGGAYTSVHERFLNRNFSVAFNPDNPNLNKILLIKKVYKDFNIPFPDSMQWVQDLYEW